MSVVKKNIGGKFKRKSVAAILALAMLCAAVPMPSEVLSASYLYNQTFEDVATGDRPAGFNYGDNGGSIEVVSGGAGKYLQIKNDTDGAYTYVEYPNLNLSNTTCEFGFDFLQAEAKSTQTVLFELKDGGETVLRIRTKGQDIVYDTNLNLDESVTLVAGYYVNKWYTFSVAVDLVNQSVEIDVGGTRFGELGFLTDSDSVTTAISYTQYSPGFMLDNISCQIQQSISSIEITGKTELFIPTSGEKTFEYRAKAFDENGNELNFGNILFDISPNNIPGVSMSQTENGMTLTVSSTANATDFVIRASVSGVIATENVSLRASTLSEIRIFGSDRIAYIENTKNTYKYDCKFYDAAGNELDGSTYTLSLKETLPGVEFDAATGTITVKGNMTNNTFVVLEAICNENPAIKTEKKIAALDIYTYRTDEQRMNKVKEYLDKILVTAADTYNGTPLLANGIDVDTEKHVTLTHIKDMYHPNAVVVPSDIAHQYNFMRVLYGMSEITGDETYRNRAREIYEYYINEGYYSESSGLLYLGGHCSIDLLTGNVDYAGSYADIHEYKDHFGFYDPWFEVDYEFARNYLKTVFVSHFYDLKNLFFNRHGSFSKTYRTNEVFEDLNAYDDSDLSIIRDSTGLTFRSAGNDMMFALLELYRHTGEGKALIWARRVLDRYIALQHPETNISVYQYNTGHKAENRKDLPDKWWLREDYSTFTTSNYGDRLQNQFADDWIRKGLYDESDRDFIVEGNLLNGVSGSYGTANLIDLKMAESIGMNTEEGRFYAENTLKAIAGVIEYGYIPEKNTFNAIMSDGTVLTGQQAERNGYYGRAGMVFTTTAPDAEFFYAVIKVLDACKDLAGVDEEKAVLWDFIRNYAKSMGLGDFGENFGDEIKVDLTASSSDPKLLISIIELYKNTGNYDLLNLARIIGNNIIDKNMSNGYFVAGSSRTYSELDDFYAYSLILLDAATRGDFTSVPVTYLGKGYFHTSYIDERGREMSPAFDFNFLWNNSRKSVYVKRITSDKQEYTLTTGETEGINLTIYPDDASSKSINWYSENPNVAIVDEKNTIYAFGQGGTKITGVSNDLKAKIELYVTVTDSSQKEE